MSAPRILTERLELIAVDSDLVLLLGDDMALADTLNARLPEDWPPEFWYEALPMMRVWVEGDRRIATGWGMWLVVLRRDPRNGQRTLIGDIGLKGPPSAEGRADVGYAIVPSRQGCGYATEATCALTSWALGHDDVRVVVGETFPTIPASIKVLERSGFVYAGTGTGHGGEEGVLRYERKKEPSS